MSDLKRNYVRDAPTKVLRKAGISQRMKQVGASYRDGGYDERGESRGIIFLYIAR